MKDYKIPSLFSMVKTIKNITLFIDDKIIIDAKVYFSNATMDITLPYYTVDGILDSSGENKIFTLMSSGNSTLESLQVQAIKETNELMRLINLSGEITSGNFTFKSEK